MSTIGMSVLRVGVLVLSVFAVATARADLDVRAPVVCMRLGDAACDDEGNVGPLYWPSDGERASVFNPLIVGQGDWSLGVTADPDEPARRVGFLRVGAPGGSGLVRYNVSNATDGRATDETPLEFWFEGEFEFGFEGELAQATDAVLLVEFRDNLAQRVQVRVRGGANPTLAAVNVSGSMLPGNRVLYSGPGLAPGVRYALRVRWIGDTAGGGGGFLRFVTVDLDRGEVLHDTAVEGCANDRFWGFAFAAGMLGDRLTASEVLWDHATYSAVGAPGEMDSVAAWSGAYAVSPPLVGAQRTMGDDATRIEARVAAVWPGSEVGVRLGAQSAVVGFEHRRVGDTEWTVGASGLDALASPMGIVAVTVGGLEPLTEYEFRAVFERDAAEARYSSAARVRTVSAAGGSPGVLRLGTYSCVSGSKMPSYAPAALARRGATEIECLGDVAYTNNEMGYNAGVEYFDFGDFAERRLEWHRLLMLQLCGPTMGQDAWAGAAHWIITDDHLFRDDLAGANPRNLRDENLAMLVEIGGFVRGSVARLFWPEDADAEARQYWWRRETSATLSLFLECRQNADHGQSRSPVLPFDLSLIPWNGKVNEGFHPLLPGDTSTWGTTVLGAAQGAAMEAAAAGTDKPIVVIHAPVMVSNGSQRDYQDLGTYPEIWEILRACEQNPRVKAVLIMSGDLHLAMVVPGAGVPSPARMRALGMPVLYRKLLWEAMVGGGGQGGHRLRWQIGNEVDADNGLRGGAWDGDADPRWDWASDFNSNWPGDETVSPADYDLYHANTWDGGAESGIGNAAKQEHAALVTIDEASLTVTLEVIDVEAETVVYTRIDEVGGVCVPDFNGDGALDSRDVLAFLAAWAAGDPAADWNGDQSVNTLDFLAYLNAWAAGC